MMRTVLVAALGVLLCGTSVAAQALPPSRFHNHVSSLRDARPLADSVVGASVFRTRGSVGAIIGGVIGVTAGLVAGHEANIGCRLGDSSCNPQSRQVKAMIVSGVLLGAVGAGLGYVVDRFWLSNQDGRNASSSRFRVINP